MRRAIVFGVPRSGTSWLGAMLGSHPRVQYRFQPIHSYTFPPSLRKDSPLDDIERFFSALRVSDDPFIHRQSMADEQGTRASEDSRSATHLIFKEVHDFWAIVNCVRLDDSISLIGLVRDPVYVLNSWIHTPAEWSSNWRVEEEWYAAKRKNGEYSGNYFGVKAWLETTHALVRLREQHPEQVMIARYHELKADPRKVLQGVFKKLGLHLVQEIEEFIEQSLRGYDPNPYSVFRGESAGGSGFAVPKDIAKEIYTLAKRNGLEDFLESKQTF